MDCCQILSNRISSLGGSGISIRTRLRSGIIKQNYLERLGRGDIVMEEGGSADSLSVENNQIFQIAPQRHGGGWLHFAGVDARQVPGAL